MPETAVRATTVRMPDNLHYHANIVAATKRMSLSEYIVSLVKADVPVPTEEQSK